MTEHWVYIVRCDDGSFYTGYTTDVDRRLREHNDGAGAKYTKGRTPVELVHRENHTTREAALAREHEIKGLSRSAKETLIGASGR